MAKGSKESKKGTLLLCSFQPKVVYEKIMEKGSYRLSREEFMVYAGMEKEYKPYHRMEKYERLMEKSDLDFKSKTTMPIWAWHKEGSGELVSPDLYEGALERARKNAFDKENYVEMVGLFLHVSKEEVYLTNFRNWDFYLFTERHDDDLSNFDNWAKEEQEDYQAQIDEAEHFFSKLEEIGEKDKVQAILPEIRKDMIVYVLEERKVLTESTP